MFSKKQNTKFHYKVPGSVMDNYRRCWNNVIAHGTTFVNEITQA